MGALGRTWAFSGITPRNKWKHWYSSMVTKRRLYFVIFISLLCSYVCYTVTSVWSSVIYLLTVIMVIILCTMIYLMTHIFLIAHAAIKEIRTKMKPEKVIVFLSVFQGQIFWPTVTPGGGRNKQNFEKRGRIKGFLLLSTKKRGRNEESFIQYQPHPKRWGVGHKNSLIFSNFQPPVSKRSLRSYFSPATSPAGTREIE